MLKNYFTLALRTLRRQRAYAALNIVGLAVGMAVALLIGLWVWDEVSFNRFHQNHDHLAQVMNHVTANGQVVTQTVNPYPLAQELRGRYGADFKAVTLAFTAKRILAVGDRKFVKSGGYLEPQAPEMLSLTMRRGTRAGLAEVNSLLLAESTAGALFGKADPLGKLVRMDNKHTVRVTGVYADLPANSSFADLTFIAPWELLARNEFRWVKTQPNPWGNASFPIFVQLADGANPEAVSAKIKTLTRDHLPKADAGAKPEIFLNPMIQWRLHSEFKNGVRTGGLIELVRLFGGIAGFVLLLACINFMNLSTARSEKRAREVGIRKAVGSRRGQLVTQFLAEALLTVAVAFGLALLLAWLALPVFNEIARKQVSIPWNKPAFWVLGLGFVGLTSLLAGSYPAFYLSSFQPVRALKGTGSSSRFRVGRWAVLPRRALVVVQFSVSVALAMGTVAVYRQLQFAKNRPVGYNRDGLVMVETGASPAVHAHFDRLRDDLKAAGAAVEVAESFGPTTEVWASDGAFSWKGKQPGTAVDFPINAVTPEFGKTVGWQFVAGRDFSRQFPTDSLAFVLTESAAKFMGLKNPVGETVYYYDFPHPVIGVIRDLVVESPYQPTRPAVFRLSDRSDRVSNFVMLKLPPAAPVREVLGKITDVFKKYEPAVPFECKFVDEEYARKFGDEERIGKLAFGFAGLALFISCLGLFGLASFVAERRTKEIGIRKVLGASVFSLWRLLSKEFVGLVLIAFALATPLAWYFLTDWLANYPYRTELSWWMFAGTGLGALLLTLLTVSFQSIKAALMNPVKSLRSE